MKIKAQKSILGPNELSSRNSMAIDARCRFTGGGLEKKKRPSHLRL